MPNEQTYTLGELGRGQEHMIEQLSMIDKNVREGHSRLRHDVAQVGQIQYGHAARLDSHERRFDDLDRDIAEVKGEVRDVRADHKKLLWAIIAAYGAIVLAVVAVFLGKAF